MTLSDQTYITAAIGDPGTTNITTAEITEAANFGDDQVFRRTGREGWVVGDDGYYSAQMAANLFAVSMLKRKFSDLANTANGDFDTAVSICDELVAVDTDEDPDLGTALIVTGSYKTAPANPDAPYTFATRSRGGAATYKDILNGFR